MFDDVILLAKGGRTAYYGPVAQVKAHFEGLGYVVPPHMNPPDFYMDVISGLVALPSGRKLDAAAAWAARHPGAAGALEEAGEEEEEAGVLMGGRGLLRTMSDASCGSGEGGGVGGESERRRRWRRAWRGARHRGAQLRKHAGVMWGPTPGCAASRAAALHVCAACTCVRVRRSNPPAPRAQQLTAGRRLLLLLLLRRRLLLVAHLARDGAAWLAGNSVSLGRQLAEAAGLGAGAAKAGGPGCPKRPLPGFWRQFYLVLGRAVTSRTREPLAVLTGGRQHGAEPQPAWVVAPPTRMGGV
jgi:hypothetical protein